MTTEQTAATGHHDGGDTAAGGTATSLRSGADTQAEARVLTLDHLTRQQRLIVDVEHLQRVGLRHLFPVGQTKTPKGQGLWRNGGTDYATTPMSLQEWAKRIASGKPHGIAVIGNAETGVAVIDVEAPGMEEPMIQAALQTLPDTCQVVTLSGGRHAYLIVDGEYPDHHKDLAAHPPGEGQTNRVLLAEVRLAPNYAVIVGPGRPPLRPDFMPHRISRDDYDRVVDMIRQAGTYVPQPPERKPYNGDGSGGGTGSIITEAVKGGSLSPLAVLPDGWQVTGHDAGGRVFVVRPGSESDTSGNVRDGVVCIHSTSVDWAPPPPSAKSAAGMTAAECLARARFGGDYNAAMRWVEQAAADLADDGTIPPAPWSEAPDVLAEIHRARQEALADYRARKEAEELQAFTPDQGDSADPDEGATDADKPGNTCSRRDVHDRFAYWFGDYFDHQYLDVVLSVALTGLRLDGDPCWLQVIGGAGVGKTEVTAALADSGCMVVSTISGEAALLSGTSAKSRAKNATGGLLRTVGARGVLVIKDFTTILSLHREKRAEILAALREIYDGMWTRNLGVDGGQTLSWSGRLTVISCVTGVYDDHHGVIAAMGDRFLSLRLDSEDRAMRQHATRRAIANVGGEAAMRQQLGDVVAGFLRNLQIPDDLAPDDQTTSRIVALADLVARARSQVSKDFKGDPENAHAAEMPTRVAKQLAQLWRGATACGLSADEALAVVERVAADSIPPDRRQVLVAVSTLRQPTTHDVALVTGMSRRKADRVLQELDMMRMIRKEQPQGSAWVWYPAEAHADDMDSGWLQVLSMVSATRGVCLLCAEMSDGVADPPEQGQTEADDEGQPEADEASLSTDIPVPDDISAQGKDDEDWMPF